MKIFGVIKPTPFIKVIGFGSKESDGSQTARGKEQKDF